MLNPTTGEPLEVKIADGTVMISKATVTTADIQTDHGVVHAIGTVLVPEMVVEAMKSNEDRPNIE